MGTHLKFLPLGIMGTHLNFLPLGTIGPIRPWNWQRLWWRNFNDSISFFLNLINDHSTISLYVNILLFSSHWSIPKVFLFRFKKNLNNTYIFEYRSTFYHNTVLVLHLGDQILGTQSSWVPMGNTRKNPKFWTLWVPNPKIPMEFRHKPNPTQPNPYPKFGSGPGITLEYPNFGYPIPTIL